MSIVRFGKRSDVYVYYSVHGDIVCCGCSLLPEDVPKISFHTIVDEMMLGHMKAHKKAGHKVPRHVFTQFNELCAEQRKMQEQDLHEQGR